MRSPSCIRKANTLTMPLVLETLEDRNVPSILFNNQTTATVTDLGGKVLDHVHVELVYWGTGWSSNVPLQNSMTSAVDTILAGPYLGALTQYRSSFGSGSHVGTATITSSSPPNVFTNSDVSAMLQANINSGALPSPANDPELLYMVIPQPGSTAGNLWGYHTYAYSTKGKFDYGWTINNSVLDDNTTYFSHELLEAASDPEGTAIQVNPPNSYDWNELSDHEAQNYTYRLSNIRVQSYLSVHDHAYIVPTGQTQNFLVSSGWVLTVQGDQLPNHDDTITLDQTGTSGLLATLNGEMAQFDPGAIHSIVVANGSGTDSINIEKTAAGQTVTVNLGSNTDTVNISPTARNLGNLQGNVYVNGGAGIDTLYVNDQANSAGQTYTVTPAIVSRPGAATVIFYFVPRVVLNGGSGNNVYNVTDTETYYSTTVNTGNGADSVNVQATAGPLTVNLGAGASSVAVASPGNNLGAIQATVNVVGGTGMNTLTVNDQADAANQTFTLTPSSVTDEGAAGIFFNNRIDKLIVNGGSGTNVYTVTDTESTYATVLDTGTGPDSVTVQANSDPLTINGNGGNGNDSVVLGKAGSVANLHSEVTITNQPSLTTLTIDDSADTVGRNVTLNNDGQPPETAFGQVNGLTTATVAYKYSDTRALNLKTGGGVVNVTVKGTYDPVALIAKPLATTTLIGSNASNTWTLTDPNVGTLSGPAVYGRVSFYDVPNLTGGTDSDTFMFLNGGGITGDLDGAGGVNTLDYSVVSSPVVVDLPTGTATGVGDKVSYIQNVMGGNGSYNILVGNGGNILTGGSNTRNLLIAGPGSGTLLGGDDQDLLIGGTTVYDADPGLLLALMGEWGRTDEDYWTRVYNLTNGIGCPLLDATTVSSNGGGNTLNGGPGLDLYYGNLAADQYDWDPANEAFISI
jgi:hypothetical protein